MAGVQDPTRVYDSPRSQQGSIRSGIGRPKSLRGTYGTPVPMDDQKASFHARSVSEPVNTAQPVLVEEEEVEEEEERRPMSRADLRRNQSMRSTRTSASRRSIYPENPMWTSNTKSSKWLPANPLWKRSPPKPNKRSILPMSPWERAPGPKKDPSLYSSRSRTSLLPRNSVRSKRSKSVRSTDTSRARRGPAPAVQNEELENRAPSRLSKAHSTRSVKSRKSQAGTLRADDTLNNQLDRSQSHKSNRTLTSENRKSVNIGSISTAGAPLAGDVGPQEPLTWREKTPAPEEQTRYNYSSSQTRLPMTRGETGYDPAPSTKPLNDELPDEKQALAHQVATDGLSSYYPPPSHAVKA